MVVYIPNVGKGWGGSGGGRTLLLKKLKSSAADYCLASYSYDLLVSSDSDFIF